VSSLIPPLNYVWKCTNKDCSAHDKEVMVHQDSEFPELSRNCTICGQSMRGEPIIYTGPDRSGARKCY